MAQVASAPSSASPATATKAAHPPIIVADLEFTASGRNLGVSKIFAMAFVLIHPDAPAGAPIPDEDKFVVFIRHDGIQNLDHPMWDEAKGTEFWKAPKQAAMRAYLLKRVATEGFDPVDAFKQAWNWLKGRVAVYPTAVLVSDGGADYERVNWGLWHYCGQNTVQFVTGEYKPYFDLSSWCMGVAKKTWVKSYWGNEKACADALGVTLPNWGVAHDHNPLNDAEKLARDYAFLISCVREM